jgi:hypothetical protein
MHYTYRQTSSFFPLSFDTPHGYYKLNNFLIIHRKLHMNKLFISCTFVPPSYITRQLPAEQILPISKSSSSKTKNAINVFQFSVSLIIW